MEDRMFFRCVRKGDVAVIAIEAVVKPVVRFVHLGQLGAIDEVQIQNSVIAIVKYGDAARHSFLPDTFVAWRYCSQRM